MTSKDIAWGIQNLSLTSTPSPPDLTTSLNHLQSLHTHYTTLKCRSCTSYLPLPQTKDHIKTWLNSAKGTQPAQISGISCSKCRKYTCVGCRDKPTMGKSWFTRDGRVVVNHCCSKGKMFGCWLLLARFDEVELALQAQCAANEEVRQREKWEKQQLQGQQQQKQAWDRYLKMRGGGSGLEGPDNGTGFSPMYGSLSSREMSGRNLELYGELDYQTQDELMDELMTSLLELLRVFLPIHESQATFDKTPPMELFAVLRLGLLIDRIAALLRNDSIEDMTKRAPLYAAVLSFVKAIARQPSMVVLLTEERVQKKRTPGLRMLGSEANKMQFVYENSDKGTAASLVSCTNETFKQATAFIALTSKVSIGQDEAAIRISKELCKAIFAFKEMVKWSAPSAIRAIEGRPSDPWEAFSLNNRVVMTDAVLTRHIFEREWSRMSYQPKGRMASLVKEISNMSTSLPPGIFLKVGESRLDVMKVLIAGIDNTPYAGGLFPFDVYLPVNWPNEPPKVNLSLNGGYITPDAVEGVFHMHIHGDGKVCLNLLNTWQGASSEMWQPGRSTLYQVFASIQSMILGDPLPGRDLSPVEYSIADHAILGWLRNVDPRLEVWRDIAKTFFKYKGEEVLDVLKNRARRNGKLGGLVRELERSLTGGSSSGSGRSEKPRYRY